MLNKVNRISRLKTKKPTLNESRLSDPTIHYTTKAKRAIDACAESMLCF
ncbi:hypothetical protein FH603_1949 [Spirosoma sp. LMG 31447]|uniref:Uncharacterized protein n=1 Tax=Spirosoma utsteinense TaxID=2585773 RepID=A0ABR6W4P5_9BACT|nr:hypothetical protein [Spirosoma utsteinense]